MDNAIRAAFDTWLPLIGNLSFDERVGFIAGLTVHPKAVINDTLRLEILSRRDEIKRAMLELQTEQLRAAQTAQTIQIGCNIRGPIEIKAPQTATPAQLRHGLAQAIEHEDWRRAEQIAGKLKGK